MNGGEIEIRRKLIKVITPLLEQEESDKEYIESVINDPAGIALSGANEALEYHRGASSAYTRVLTLLRSPKLIKELYKTDKDYE